MNVSPAHDHKGLTVLERRAAIGLSGVYGVRMFGLFLILPVFSLYAVNLEGVTPTLVGLAIGIYGLAQALLQIPLGILSDGMGRKSVIVAGLLVFALGSVVAALSTTIWGVIIGRALQGAGAIAGATLALAADLTRDSVRTAVMAIIGMSIGLAFALAMVLGPLLNGYIGVPGLFWVTAGLALIVIAIVVLYIPTPTHARKVRDASWMGDYLAVVLGNRELLRLNLGVFVLHMMLTATFVVVPIQLKEGFGLPTAQHGMIYLGEMLLGFALMLPFIIIGEKRRRIKGVFVGAVATLLIGELLLYFTQSHFWGLLGGLLVFFAAFNLLEASLPSLVSKVAPADAKGTAMGIYATAQFLGIFCGGVIGGYLHQHFGIPSVFLFGAGMVAVWLSFAATMRQPRYLSTYVLNVGPLEPGPAQDLVARLTQVPGVAEAVVVAKEGMAYLKVDKRALDEQALMAYSAEAA